jgi:hypothetical protein
LESGKKLISSLFNELKPLENNFAILTLWCDNNWNSIKIS